METFAGPETKTADSSVNDEGRLLPPNETGSGAEIDGSQGRGGERHERRGRKARRSSFDSSGGGGCERHERRGSKAGSARSSTDSASEESWDWAQYLYNTGGGPSGSGSDGGSVGSGMSKGSSRRDWREALPGNIKVREDFVCLRSACTQTISMHGFRNDGSNIRTIRQAFNMQHAAPSF